MDLVQIRYFLALASTLNFTRAAEQCHVTQPALTKSIRRLEEELGGPLLRRERALTQLTELGRSMLPLLEQTFQAAERAREHAMSLRRAPPCTLRLGFAPDVPVDPFLPIVSEVARRLPALELTLAEDATDALVAALLHDTLDVAVVPGHDALVARLNRWTLFADGPVVLLPPGDTLAELDRVPVSRLAGRPMVGRVADGGGDGGANGALPPPRHRATTAAHAILLVRAGFGLALSTRRAVADPAVVSRPLDPAREHDVVLVAVAGRPHGRAAYDFMKLARARDWPPG